MSARRVLLIGEVLVDVTITPRGQPQKLRLGGIIHAARGLWAHGAAYSASVVLPSYLEQTARRFLNNLKCDRFEVLGYVVGAPNVVLIFDPTEVSDQEYDMLLRDEASTNLSATADFTGVTDALVFPGSYDVASVIKTVPPEVALHVDVAYDVGVDQLAALGRKVDSMLLSTSSPLFLTGLKQSFDELKAMARRCVTGAVVLKENRGGSRLYSVAEDATVEIPAYLGSTANSVGVGDVFDAVFVSARDAGWTPAGLRAALASYEYAQTTYPDDFRREIERSKRLTEEEVKELRGVSLPWEARQERSIYLAAPDFSYVDTTDIERAVSALTYHNFRVRRPVRENGEIASDSTSAQMSGAYWSDRALLEECSLVFAVAVHRDAGTLVEVGLALEKGLPVVVFDPHREATNTMVVAGSICYSSDLDECLNAVFTAFATMRRAK